MGLQAPEAHLQPAAVKALVAASEGCRQRNAVKQRREVGAAAGLTVQQRLAGPAASSGGRPLAEGQMCQGLPVVRLGPAGAQRCCLLAIKYRLQIGLDKVCPEELHT